MTKQRRSDSGAPKRKFATRLRLKRLGRPFVSHAVVDGADNLLPKIRMPTTLCLMSALDRDLPFAEKGRGGSRFSQTDVGCPSGRGRYENMLAAERPQPLVKSRFGRETPRESKQNQIANPRKGRVSFCEFRDLPRLSKLPCPRRSGWRRRLDLRRVAIAPRRLDHGERRRGDPAGRRSRVPMGCARLWGKARLEPVA